MKDEIKLYSLEEMKSMLESGIMTRKLSTLEDQVFLEDANPAIKSKSWLAVIMEHFLKLAYCSSEIVLSQNYKNWTKSISNARESIRSEVTPKNRKKLLLYLEINLNEIYKNSIKKYGKAQKKNEYLPSLEKVVPEDCPWEVEDLLKENLIQFIVNQLPDITEYAKNLYMYTHDMELDDG